MSPTQQSIHRHIIDTITSYYTFLTRLPHIDSSNLVFPPSPSGWQTINEVELRGRGRTEDAINLLRHLPYLRNSLLPHYTANNITNTSLSIAYCDGEFEPAWVHDQQPTPGHIIWLADQADKEGHYLLLDTQVGCITVWSPIYPGPPLPDGVIDEDILEPIDRWMNYATLSVEDFLEKFKLRYVKLNWIPVPGLRWGNDRGSGHHYERIVTRGFENEYLYSDDDYVDDEGSDSTEEGDVMDGDEGEVEGEEIDLLMADAGLDRRYVGGEISDPVEELSLQAHAGERKPKEDEYQTDMAFEDTPAERKQTWLDTKHAYYIYKNNGWPGNNWDRERCKEQLEAWVKAKGMRS